ncbi:hypothetical protein Ancab_034663 [Ancistrocladus abbreviatus]
MFQNVHRLYGVSNIIKILKQLRDDQKDEAMRSIIYESDMRRRFPVYGCLGIVWQLRQQLKYYQDEFYYISSLLTSTRGEQCHGRLGIGSSDDDDDLRVANLYNHQNQSQCQYVEKAMNQSWNCDDKSLDNTHMVDQMLAHQQGDANYINLNGINENTSSNFLHHQIMGIDIDQQEIDVYQDSDDMPSDKIAGASQSFVEYKGASDSSAESSVKDMMGPIDMVCQNDLKSAAACFSLTSFN